MYFGFHSNLVDLAISGSQLNAVTTIYNHEQLLNNYCGHYFRAAGFPSHALEKAVGAISCIQPDSGKEMMLNQVKFDFPFLKQTMVEQYLLDNATDILIKSAEDVKWIVGNKLHMETIVRSAMTKLEM
jgi:hypothetical protein